MKLREGKLLRVGRFAVVGGLIATTLVMSRTTATAQSGIDGEIRVNVTASFRDFGVLKTGSNLGFQVPPGNLPASVPLGAQLIARTAQATKFLRFPASLSGQLWGWASCEADPTGVTPYPNALKCFDDDHIDVRYRRNLTTGPLVKVAEFIKFAKAAGSTEQIITLNTNATSRENGALAAYINGSVGNTTLIGVDQRGADWKTVGFWAQKRVDAGIVDPLGAKYWEFGNETFGGGIDGVGTGCTSGWEKVWTCDPVEYINGKGTGATKRNGFLENRTLLKSLFPDIKMGAPAVETKNERSTPWSGPLIAAGGSSLDFLEVHPYFTYVTPLNTAAGNAEILAYPQSHWSRVDNEFSLLESAAGITNKIPIIISEYALTPGPDQEPANRINQVMNAMLIGDSIGQMGLNSRYLGSNQFTLYQDLHNGNEYGLMGTVGTNYQDAYRRPTYYAMALWQKFGDKITNVSSTFNSASIISAYGGLKGAKTMVYVVNKTNSDKLIKVTVDGVQQVSSAYADVLQGTTINDDFPTFNGAVAPATNLAGTGTTTANNTGDNTVTRVFPAASITLLELTTTGTAVVTSSTSTTTTTVVGCGSGSFTGGSFAACNGDRFNALTPNRILDSRSGIGTNVHQIGAGETVQLQVTGNGGVPAGATAAVMNVTVTGASGDGYVIAYPCDQPKPDASNLNFISGQTIPNLISVRLSAAGKACLFASAPAHLIGDVAGYYATSGQLYTGLAPTRLLDTRSGLGTTSAHLLNPGEIVSLQVSGRGGVAAGASSAVLNITVTQTGGSGWITVYPCGSIPDASNLNYVQNLTIANLVYARLDANGRACLFTTTPTQLIADVAGYFSTNGIAFHPLQPSRILDTRTGVGTNGATTRVGAGSVIVVNVRGAGGTSSAATSAVLNVTVTSATGAGYLTIYPCDTVRPDSSNLNFSANQDIANLVNAQLSATGQTCIFSSADTHVVADVNGYF